MFKLVMSSVSFPDSFDKRTCSLIKYLSDLVGIVSASDFKLVYDEDNEIDVDWVRDPFVNKQLDDVVENMCLELFSDDVSYTELYAVIADKQTVHGSAVVDIVFRTDSGGVGVMFRPLMRVSFALACSDDLYIKQSLIEEVEHLADQVVAKMTTKKVNGVDVPVNLSNRARANWSKLYTILGEHVDSFTNDAVARKLRTKNPYLRFFISPILRVDVVHHWRYAIEIVLNNDIGETVYSGDRFLVDLK